MPYKINPFTGNPDYYDASTGGTVTSVASGTGLTGGPITTTGTLSVDSATVPYYAGGPGSAGFVKWNGTAWAIDTTSYVNKAGDTMTGSLILNADPTTALGAATKQYVDNIATGINFHAPVVAATTGPLPAVTYSNGVGGVGATLIATSPGALTIDTVTFLGGGTERVLIKNQVSGLENGIYVVNVAGDGVTPFQLTRATDADNSPAGELAFGDFCFVEQGPTNGGFGYILNTTGTITVGVTALSYVIFNAAQVVTAGTGLTELPTNTLNIDTAKVPYYSGGFSAGFAKWDGSNWIFDNSTYLDTTTAASTYLTIANAITTYYPLSSNPAGYLTSASLSGYVPYTGATGNVSLGAFQLTTSQVNISTAGALTTTAGVLKLEAAAATNLILNTPNVTTGASTKIQFGGSDLIELKGLASTATVTNFRYTNPNNINQQGPISSMIIDPGTRTWDYTNVPNGPTDVQKEIEILSPNYTDNNPGPPSTWDGLAVTLYVNPPVTNTTGVGYGLGIKGHFLIDGDASEYPGGTYMNIGNGDGTMIGFNGAKLSFFGNPPISKPAAVTTVQGLANALSSLGLLAVSTITSGLGTVTSVGLTTGTTGTDINIGAGTSPVTSSGTITLNIPTASATNRGALSSTDWTTFNSKFSLPALTSGSVLFSNGSTITQDNANFFWDDTNNRLGIGNNTPSEKLDILGLTKINGTSIWVNKSSTNSQNYAIFSTGSSTYFNDASQLLISINANQKITLDANTYLFQNSASNGVATRDYDFDTAVHVNYPTGVGNSSVRFNLRGKQWVAGAIATQQEFVLTGPNYSFTGASTITTAYNLFVNPPTAGTNATITNNFAAGFAGNVYVQNGLIVGSTTAALAGTGQIYAQSGFYTNANSSLAGIFGYTNNVSIYSKLVTGIVDIGTTAGGNPVMTIASTTVTLADAKNIVVGTTTGTKIGTATTQKLGFFNATPIVQPAAVTTVQGLADALGSATGLGLIATSVITLPVVIQAACSDETSNLTTGTAKVTFRMPHAMTLTAIRASLTTAQASGTLVTVDVNLNGVSVLGTKLTFNNTQTTTTTATTPATIVTSALTDDGEITVDIDAIGAAGAKGLKITLIGTRV